MVVVVDLLEVAGAIDAGRTSDSGRILTSTFLV